MLRIGDENAGRQARCPSCSAVFTAPPLAAADPPPAPIANPVVDDLASAREPSAGSAPPDPANPYAPTYTEPERPHHLGTEWGPRLFTADEALSKAWAIFKEQWVMVCVAALIVAAVNFVASMAQSITQGVMENVVNEPAVVVLVMGTMTILMYIVQFWLQLGQTMVMLDVARGKQVEIGKLFSGGRYLANFVVGIILFAMMFGAIALVCVGIPAAAVGLATQEAGAAGVAALIGLLIAAVPFIYISLMFSQFQPLIVDRGLNAFDALKTSAEITKGNKMTLFVLILMLGLIGIAAFIVGLLALCVGVFPAMIAVSGFSALTFVVAYLCITGQTIVVPGQLATPNMPTYPSEFAPQGE